MPEKSGDEGFDKVFLLWVFRLFGENNEINSLLFCLRWGSEAHNGYNRGFRVLCYCFFLVGWLRCFSENLAG